MDADKFIVQLSQDHPNFVFKPHNKFAFRPPKTIFYGPLDDPDFNFFILHELAHALLGHFNFRTDAERLKMECAAWEKTAKLCQEYHINFNSSLSEQELDTYRDWLHTKSRCKKCGLTRYQTPDGHYHCPHCD